MSEYQLALFGARRRPKPPAPRDEVWDALCAMIPRPPWTPSERGRWNRAAKELRDAGVTGEQVVEACRAYRKRWPDVLMTPTAITANLSSLLGPDPALDRYRRVATADLSSPDPLRS